MRYLGVRHRGRRHALRAIRHAVQRRKEGLLRQLLDDGQVGGHGARAQQADDALVHQAAQHLQNYHRIWSVLGMPHFSSRMRRPSR